MEGLPLEAVGIGSVALGFGVLFWRIYQKQAEQADKILEVVTKNTEASVELKNTVGSIGKSIEANLTQTTKNGDSVDRFTGLVVELLKDRR